MSNIHRALAALGVVAGSLTISAGLVEAHSAEAEATCSGASLDADWYPEGSSFLVQVDGGIVESGQFNGSVHKSWDSPNKTQGHLWHFAITSADDWPLFDQEIQVEACEQPTTTSTTLAETTTSTSSSVPYVPPATTMAPTTTLGYVIPATTTTQVAQEVPTTTPADGSWDNREPCFSEGPSEGIGVWSQTPRGADCISDGTSLPATGATTNAIAGLACIFVGFGLILLGVRLRTGR